jgi:amino acid transporter
MGKYQFLHRSMGLVHDTHRTPHRAIIFCGGLMGVICMAMVPAGFLNAFGYAGTFASFGFVVVYLMLCIVAPMDLQRTREMKSHHVLLGVAGSALMLFVIFGSVYPVPSYPYNLLPYVFFAYMVLGRVVRHAQGEVAADPRIDSARHGRLKPSPSGQPKPAIPRRGLASRRRWRSVPPGRMIAPP